MTNNMPNNPAIIYFFLMLLSRIREAMVFRSIREHENIQKWECMQ